MKFIKTVDGTYLNVNFLEQLNVNGLNMVIAYYHEGKDYYALSTRFESREEAQAYLDKLVAELNEEKTCGE